MKISKRVVIIGAGPCGLVALKEMLEMGHEAVVLEKSPGIGGIFSSTHDTQYENLYLTISNMFMAFSDFPPEDLRLEDWVEAGHSKQKNSFSTTMPNNGSTNERPKR